MENKKRKEINVYTNESILEEDEDDDDDDDDKYETHINPIMIAKRKFNSESKSNSESESEMETIKNIRHSIRNLTHLSTKTMEYINNLSKEDRLEILQLYNDMIYSYNDMINDLM